MLKRRQLFTYAIEYSLQNVVDARSLLEFGTAQGKFTKKDPPRTIKYEDTASD